MAGFTSYPADSQLATRRGLLAHPRASPPSPSGCDASKQIGTPAVERAYANAPHPSDYLDVPTVDTLRDSSSEPPPSIQAIPHTLPSPFRMPVQHLSLSSLRERSHNFQTIRRVSASRKQEVTDALLQYRRDGQPLIIEGWHKEYQWTREIFELSWLADRTGDAKVQVRNVHDRRDKTMSLAEFIEISRATPYTCANGEVERLYWKDGHYPPQYKQWLSHSGIPTELLPEGPDDLFRHSDESERVESLMLYLGIGDTFTPAHKDLCASSGHNLMCYSEDGGSSFWFMTKSSDAAAAARYFQKHLHQELDWESHVASVDDFANAPFTVYIAEQKLGDLVLVPPRSCHQVVNHGGLALKMSWSRMTVDSMRIALHHELPVYRRVCRSEQYRVKSLLYRSMVQYGLELDRELGRLPSSSTELTADPPSDHQVSVTGSLSPLPLPPLSLNTTSQATVARLKEELTVLIKLFDELLCEEYAGSRRTLETICQPGRGTLVFTGPQRIRMGPPRDGEKRDPQQQCNFACDFCGADIFQSFFECLPCQNWGDNPRGSHGDGLTICPACYVEGRSCLCGNMDPIQSRPFDVLLRARNRAALTLRHAGVPHEDVQTRLEEGDLKLSNTVRVFEAGIQLQEKRMTKVAGDRTERKCSSGSRATNTAHMAPYWAVIPCPGCHRSRCFKHHLRSGTHSAEALLAPSLHELHVGNAKLLRAGRTCEHDGHENPSLRLWQAAANFSTCRPHHQNTKPGWYDQHGDDFEDDELDSDDYASIPALEPTESSAYTLRTATFPSSPCSPLSTTSSLTDLGSDSDSTPPLAPAPPAPMNPPRTTSSRSVSRSMSKKVVEVVVPEPPLRYRNKTRQRSPLPVVERPSKKLKTSVGLSQSGPRQSSTENSERVVESSLRREESPDLTANDYGSDLAAAFTQANRGKGPAQTVDGRGKRIAPRAARPPQYRTIITDDDNSDDEVVIVSSHTRVPRNVDVSAKSQASDQPPKRARSPSPDTAARNQRPRKVIMRNPHRDPPKAVADPPSASASTSQNPPLPNGMRPVKGPKGKGPPGKRVNSNAEGPADSTGSRSVPSDPKGTAPARRSTDVRDIRGIPVDAQPYVAPPLPRFTPGMRERALFAHPAKSVSAPQPSVPTRPVVSRPPAQPIPRPKPTPRAKPAAPTQPVVATPSQGQSSHRPMKVDAGIQATEASFPVTVGPLIEAELTRALQHYTASPHFQNAIRAAARELIDAELAEMVGSMVRQLVNSEYSRELVNVKTAAAKTREEISNELAQLRFEYQKALNSSTMKQDRDAAELQAYCQALENGMKDLEKKFTDLERRMPTSSSLSAELMPVMQKDVAESASNAITWELLARLTGNKYDPANPVLPGPPPTLAQIMQEYQPSYRDVSQNRSNGDRQAFASSDPEMSTRSGSVHAPPDAWQRPLPVATRNLASVRAQPFGSGFADDHPSVRQAIELPYRRGKPIVESLRDPGKSGRTLRGLDSPREPGGGAFGRGGVSPSSHSSGLQLHGIDNAPAQDTVYDDRVRRTRSRHVEPARGPRYSQPSTSGNYGGRKQ